MQLNRKIAVVEAIIFAAGDPIEAEKVAEGANVETETVHKFVRILNDRYEENDSALEIIKLGNSYQLTARSEFADAVKAAMETKKQAPLTPAAMEVLTIIAYNQPVSKSFVEHIRGVESSNIVNSLVEKNLLEEAGRLDVPGKPIAYRTTQTFLRCFRLSSLADLPPLPGHDEQVSFDDILINDD